MNQRSIKKAIQLFLDDPAFRAEMKRDPEGALRKKRYRLTPENLAELKNVNWQSPDYDLDTKAKKRLAAKPRAVAASITGTAAPSGTAVPAAAAAGAPVPAAAAMADW